MRSVLSHQSRQLSKACDTTARQSFASTTISSSSAVCHICRTQPRSTSTVLSKPSRRWASSSASDDVIKSNTIPTTHYEFFPKSLSKGPPPTGQFMIDLKKLRNEFLQLQAVAHPDRHPSSLKTRAEATSARINEAYKTLQNPLLRAQYLLSLRGLDVSEDETAKVEDPEFLMEVMDIRETIDNSRDEAEIEQMKKDNEKRIADSEEMLEGAFAEENMEVAQEETIKLRYWVNIRDSLDEWEEQRIRGEK